MCPGLLLGGRPLRYSSSRGSVQPLSEPPLPSEAGPAQPSGFTAPLQVAPQSSLGRTGLQILTARPRTRTVCSRHFRSSSSLALPPLRHASGAVDQCFSTHLQVHAIPLIKPRPCENTPEFRMVALLKESFVFVSGITAFAQMFPSLPSRYFTVHKQEKP